MTQSKHTTRLVSPNPLGRIVGKNIYDAWVAMLKALVPGGHTHRLAVVVAGMMLYAASVVDSNDDDELVQSLLDTPEDPYDEDPVDVPDALYRAFARLFKDAGLTFRPTRARGHDDSILEQAYVEFNRLNDYPWD